MATISRITHLTNVKSHSEKHPTAAPMWRMFRGVISGAYSQGTEFQLIPKEISKIMSIPRASFEDAEVSRAIPTVNRVIERHNMVDPSIRTFRRPSRSTRKIGGNVPTQKAI